MPPTPNLRSPNSIEILTLNTNVQILTFVGKGFNQDVWLDVESYSRQLIHQYKHVYIVSGPLFLSMYILEIPFKYLFLMPQET